MGGKTIVLKAIKELGPLTAEEFAEDQDIPLNYARAYISYCKKHRYIHVLKYKRESEVGNVAYPRAVYALGDKPDAPKPPRMTKTEANRRHRAKKRNRRNSVFAMGSPIDDMRLTTRKRPDVSEKMRNKRSGALGSA